jgi:FkbM family methyltransferase
MARLGLLVKIDTEGSEAAILRGAGRTLAERRPLIIFESFRDDGREELYPGC